MNTITLPTTLRCGGCVEAVKPFFDGSSEVNNWSVDLKPAIRTITAEGENLTEADVVALLREAGFDVLEAKKEDHSLPQID